MARDPQRSQFSLQSKPKTARFVDGVNFSAAVADLVLVSPLSAIAEYFREKLDLKTRSRYSRRRWFSAVKTEMSMVDLIPVR